MAKRVKTKEELREQIEFLEGMLRGLKDAKEGRVSEFKFETE